MTNAFSPFSPAPRAMPHIPEDVPCYKIVGKGAYLDDTHYEEGDIVACVLPPNSAMLPLNALARTKVDEMIAELDASYEEENKNQKVKLLRPLFPHEIEEQKRKQEMDESAGSVRFLNAKINPNSPLKNKPRKSGAQKIG
jgi:hypothetical protein